MIDILNNVDKTYVTKKPIKAWIYPLDTLEAGIFLTLDAIEVQQTSCNVKFSISKDNDLSKLSKMMMDKRVEMEIKSKEIKKEMYERMIKIWEEKPGIFKQQYGSYNSHTYICTIKDMFTNYTVNLSTGCGSDTYYSKEFYVDALKVWDKTCADEIKKLTKNPKVYTRDLLKAEIIINSRQLDNFIELKEQTTNIDALEDLDTIFRKSVKPEFPVVFEADELNSFLSEVGGDFDVSDELIEELREEDEELAEKFEKLNGCVFTVEHEGEHNHDGQMCDYTITVLTPDNHEYYAHNTHCLVTGWNFHGQVKFE